MKPKNAYDGDIIGENSDYVFQSSGEIMIRADIVLANYQEKVITHAIPVSAGMTAAEVRNAFIDWLSESNSDSLPAAVATSYYFEAFAPEFGEELDIEDAMHEQYEQDYEAPEEDEF